MNRKAVVSVLVLACAAFVLTGARQGLVQAGDSKPAVPATSQPVQQLAFGQGEYRVGPEDVIEVFVWKDADLSRTVPVRPDGKISLPLVGELEASGKTASQLQGEIGIKLQRYVATPFVTVTVKEVNYPKVSVLGQVRKPDRYHIKQRITVLEAVAMAGGFTEFAKRDKITIIRQRGSDETRMQIDLKKVLKDPRGGAFYLEPFDTVYVE